MKGAVLCLAQAAQYLFSGGQDTTIKIWSFDAATQAFQPLVCFLAACIINTTQHGTMRHSLLGFKTHACACIVCA